MGHRKVMRILGLIVPLVCAALAGGIAAAQDKMEWFRHDKFGMFVHWGGGADNVADGQFIRCRSSISTLSAVSTVINPIRGNSISRIT